MSGVEVEGAAPAEVEQAHPFEPRWGRSVSEDMGRKPGPNAHLCRHCNLAEAAHTSSAAPYQPTGIRSERPPGRNGGSTQTAVS